MTEKGDLSQETVVIEEYDESNYPAKAESDDECVPETRDNVNEFDQQNSGLTRKLEDQYSMSDDVTCVVCSEVLVDPCTLHCGHSFCLLCLASIWKTKTMPNPTNLQCPVCREPWGSYPGINIQLRNIIERSYGKVVELRRGQRSAADLNILSQYNNAKKKLFGNAQVFVHHFQRQRWFISMLTLALCGAVVVMVVLVTILAVSMGGPSGEYMRKPVSHWNHDDVMSWLGGLGDWAHHNISYIFTKEKISGPQLLLLDKPSLKSLGVQNEFHLQSLVLAVQQLKENAISSPRNFYEFLAAHRKKTFLVLMLYKQWPRLSFLYVYLFDYYQIFLPVWHYSRDYLSEETAEDSITVEEPTKWQLLLFGVEVLLVPHYIVGVCAWYWRSVHIFLCSAMIIHCLWSTQQEAKEMLVYVSSRRAALWRQEVLVLGRSILVNVLSCAVVALINYAVWPIVPYFVCNLALHWMIWQSAFTLACIPFKLLIQKYLLNRRRRQNVIP